MTTYTVEQADTADLVGIVLGLQPTDETVVRLAAAMKEGWLSGSPLTDCAREGRGVGERKLARLEASVELGRRALHATAARRGRIISSPEDVAEIMRPLLVGLTQERFYALALNTKLALLRVIPISAGSINASIVSPSVLFREAIQIGASALVCVHAHPSNIAESSSADRSLTAKLRRCGEILSIDVVDHIVIGGDQLTSLRDEGCFG